MRIKTGISWTWRKLLRFRDGLGVLLGIRSKMGMWHDSWYPMGSMLLKHALSDVYNAASSLQAKLCLVISGNSWAWPGVRSDYQVDIQSSLFDIHPCQDRDDIVIWTPSNSGIYQSSTIWNSIRSHGALVPWYVLVWFQGFTPRHSFIT